MNLFGASAPGSVQTIETAVARAPEASRRLTPAQKLAQRIQERHNAERSPLSDFWQTHVPPTTPGEETFWHSGWAPARARLRKALVRTGASESTLHAWDNCGSDCWVMRHKEDGRRRLSANHCHHRFCLPCQRKRSRLIGANVRKALTARYYLHIVLTLKSTDEPLAAEMSRTYRSFKRLRAKPLWKHAVAGGAAFLEVTLNQKTGKFHPHLHVLAQARFIPQEQLSATWLKITGDSSIVWIERVKDRDSAAAEVSKYVTKPLHRSLFDDEDRLDEFILALKGRRLCLTFGTWHKISLTDRGDEFNRDDWIPECRLDDLLARYEAGEVHAGYLLEWLAKDSACASTPPPSSPRLFPSTAAPSAPSATGN